MNHCSLAAGTSTQQKGIAMKALLAAIIAASLSVGCSVLEGEQVSSDTGGGGTTSPVPSRNNSNGPTVYMDCDSGVESPTRSVFGEYSTWSRNVTNCDGDGWVSADTTDENGNFYFMTNGGSGPTNTKIVKLNNNGTEQWSQELSSDFGTSGGSDANRLVVDIQGNIYGIASDSHHYGHYSDNQTIKRTLFKYSSAGVEQWQVEDTYTVEAGSHSYGHNPLEVFVDSNGNFYTSRKNHVEIYYSDNGSYDRYQQTIIDKYSSTTGEKLWRKEFVSDNTYYHHSTNVVFESSGGFYIRTQEDVYDNVSSSTSTEYEIVKYNNDGVEQWSKSINNYDSMNLLTVDGDSVYFIEDTDYGPKFVKYSHAGVAQWKNSIHHSYGEIGLAQDGSVYLSAGYRITKYSSAGSVLWIKEEGFDSHRIQIDRNGNVYVSHEGRKYYDNGTLKSIQPTLTKYNSSNGFEQWKLDVMDVTVDASAYDHIHSWSDSIIDASGDVFVRSHVHGYKSGSSTEDENRFDQTSLAKYSSDGTKLWEEANNDWFHGGLTAGKNGEVYLFDEQHSNFDSMGYPMGPGTSFYLKLR
jgi:hypothetical protein